MRCMFASTFSHEDIGRPKGEGQTEMDLAPWWKVTDVQASMKTAGKRSYNCLFHCAALHGPEYVHMSTGHPIAPRHNFS
jgi:hypothetical protein